MLRDAIERQCDEFTRSRGILFSRPARDLLFMSLDAMTTDPTELPQTDARSRYRELLNEQARLVDTELTTFLKRLCDLAQRANVTRITYFDMLGSVDRFIRINPKDWSNIMLCVDKDGPAAGPRTP